MELGIRSRNWVSGARSGEQKVDVQKDEAQQEGSRTRDVYHVIK